MTSEFYSSPSPDPDDGDTVTHETSGDWVTLREASERAGVSVSTLRNWFRDGKIESRLAPGPTGDRRIVRISEVLERTGRSPAGDRQDVLVEVVLQPQVDVGGSLARAEEPAVVVPRSAWQKMLEQLGALHDAGRRLTEATERAARAEERYAFEVERRKLLEDRVAQLEKVALLAPVDGRVGEPVREGEPEVHGVLGVGPAVPPLPDEEPDVQPVLDGSSMVQPLPQEDVDPVFAGESVMESVSVEEQEPVAEEDERELFAFEAYRRQLLEARPELKSAERISPATPWWQRGVDNLQEWIRKGREESYFLEEEEEEEDEDRS